MATHPTTESSKNDKNYHKPHTVDDLTQRNVETIVQLEETARADRTRSDCIADAISRFCGSMSFVWAHLIGFACWIIINTVPGVAYFDPFPFTFLTLIVSLEAIFLSTFILISQNHETRLSERRNHLDLQINLLAEQENTKMLTLLERIAKKVGARTDDDPHLQVLEQSTQPEKLVDQIEETTKQSTKAFTRKSSDGLLKPLGQQSNIKANPKGGVN
jgi:uncharacterized membrane protein